MLASTDTDGQPVNRRQDTQSSAMGREEKPDLISEKSFCAQTVMLSTVNRLWLDSNAAITLFMLH